MIRLICFAVFFVFLGFDSGAQIDTSKIRKKIKGIDILVVPYNPDLYINYEEIYISQKSKKSLQQLNNIFRKSLTGSVVNELSQYCKPVNMDNNYTYNSEDMLFRLYSKSAYFYDKAANIDKNYTVLASNHSKLSGKEHNKGKGELNSKISDNANKFLNVKFSEKSFLSSVSEQYKSNYILIITQFELKANYSNTYAVNSMTYKRRIKVHFSLFNKYGKFITGSFAYSDFSASINDVEEIIKQTMPVISQDIVSKIALAL